MSIRREAEFGSSQCQRYVSSRGWVYEFDRVRKRYFVTACVFFQLDTERGYSQWSSDTCSSRTRHHLRIVKSLYSRFVTSENLISLIIIIIILWLLSFRTRISDRLRFVDLSVPSFVSPMLGACYLELEAQIFQHILQHITRIFPLLVYTLCRLAFKYLWVLARVGHRHLRLTAVTLRLYFRSLDMPRLYRSLLFTA